MLFELAAIVWAILTVACSAAAPPTAHDVARSLSAASPVVDLPPHPDIHAALADDSFPYCGICKTVFGWAQKAVKGKIGKDVVVYGGTLYCLANKGSSPWHCEGKFQCDQLCGIVKDWAPTVFEVVGMVEEVGVLCSRAKLCPPTNMTAHTRHMSSAALRALEKEMHREQVAPETPQGDDYYVAHVTDIHMNQVYKANSWTDCGLPSCCSDYPYTGRHARTANTSAGTYGDYMCDAPPALVNAFADDVAKQHALQPLTAIVYTGDSPAHQVWNQSRAQNTQVIVEMSTMLAKSLPKGLPVLPALGNHAGFPVSSFDTLSIEHDFQGAYQPIADAWQQFGWFNATHAADFMKTGGAYYADIPGTKLSVVALNSNFFVSGNLFNLPPRSDTVDPGHQLAFLNDSLVDAAARGRGVFTLWHHPLGDWFPNRQAVIHELVARYPRTVRALLTGHTHMDEMHVVWDPSSTVPLTMQYEPGSITPLNGRNPGWRIYTLNGEGIDARISDFRNRRANLRALGWLHNTSSAPLVFSDAYTARAAYGLPDLSPASWVAFARRMYNDTALFSRYWLNRATGNHEGKQPTNRTKAICQIIASTKEAKKQCHP